MNIRLIIIVLSVLITTVFIVLLSMYLPRILTNSEEIELPAITAEDAIKYIIEDYTVLNDNFLQDYVDTTYPTNEYIIDKLSSYDAVKKINKIGEQTYEVYTDDTVLYISLYMQDNKINKILVKEE